MNCPKCKSEGQNGNFCSNCGEKLKERCRECGQMERIGRKICDEKIRQIEEKIADYQNKNSRNYSLIGVNTAMIVCILCSTLFLISVVFPINIGWKVASIIFSMGVFGVLTFMVVGLTLQRTLGERKRKQIKQKFLQFHPDYAEVLLKAERN